MRRELIDQGLDKNVIIALPTFYRIWKDDFGNVIIPQVTGLYKSSSVTAAFLTLKYRFYTAQSRLHYAFNHESCKHAQ